MEKGDERGKRRHERNETELRPCIALSLRCTVRPSLPLSKEKGQHCSKEERSKKGKENLRKSL
jgi:hypothetical protein